MLARWFEPTRLHRRRRTAAPAVELSERKLEKVINALSGLKRSSVPGDRPSPRLQVQADVTLLPFRHGRSGRATQAKIHDISAAGVAVKMAEPLAVGTQFKLLIPRRFRRSIEVLCTARHCRASEGTFIVGAEYGVSWLETLGTLVGPGDRSPQTFNRPSLKSMDPIDSDLAVA